MGLFRRKKIQTQPVPGRDDQILIDPETADWVIQSLSDRVVMNIYESIDSDVQSLFSVGLYLTTNRDISTDSSLAIEIGQTAARLGYVTRQCEVDAYDAASDHVESLELRNILQKVVGEPGPDRTAEAASRLAAWPPEYSQEAGETPVAMVPGIGGHVRSAVADHLLLGIYEAPEVESSTEDLPSQEDLKVVWNYGFMLHVFQEVAPEEAAIGLPRPRRD